MQVEERAHVLFAEGSIVQLIVGEVKINQTTTRLEKPWQVEPLNVVSVQTHSGHAEQASEETIIDV